MVAAKTHLCSQRIEPPTPERLERLIHSVVHHFESNLFEEIAQKLSISVRENLDLLLKTSHLDSEEQIVQKAVSKDPKAELFEDTPANQAPITILKTDPGRLGLDSWTKEADKLQQLRQLNLPPDLFNGISPKILEIYKQRVAVEPPRELRRHPENRRYTLLSAFCWLRLTEITDNLVELLIQIINESVQEQKGECPRNFLMILKKLVEKLDYSFN